MKAFLLRTPIVLLLSALLVVAAVLAISQGLSQAGPLPFSLVVDGQDLSAQFSLAGLDRGHRLVAAGVALLLALALVVFVPVMLLALLLVVGGIVLAAVGAPLLVVAAALALLLSPLIVLVLLLRWLLR